MESAGKTMSGIKREVKVKPISINIQRHFNDMLMCRKDIVRKIDVCLRK